jgi:signal recognition particle receptor subunit beta
MALVNDAKKEINAKIVYIGPKGAGKDTALRYLYSCLPPEHRSELKSLTSGGQSMLFFDFAFPVHPGPDVYQVRFHLYTLLSGEGAAPPWKMLLKGVDGVVFLADSAAGRMAENIESCAQLYDAFAHYGIKSGDIPVSLQCNKRDLVDALPLAQLHGELFPELDVRPLPVVATEGDGLLSGLYGLAGAVVTNLGQALPESVFPETAVEAVVEREAASADEPAVAEVHCQGENSGFSIESAGTPVSLADGKVLIPLRLMGGECGKSIDFTVTVAVSL